MFKNHEPMGKLINKMVNSNKVYESKWIFHSRPDGRHSSTEEKLHMIHLVLVTVSAYRNSSFPELGKPGREVIKLKDRSLLKFSEFDANKITY